MTEAQQWAVNQQWLDDAINRNDVIRSISNPFDNNNIYKKVNDEFVNANGQIISESNLPNEGVKSFYGKEVQSLQDAGYIYNATEALWFIP